MKGQLIYFGLQDQLSTINLTLTQDGVRLWASAKNSREQTLRSIKRIENSPEHHARVTSRSENHWTLDI